MWLDVRRRSWVMFADYGERELCDGVECEVSEKSGEIEEG